MTGATGSIQRAMIARALRIAAVVGTILVAINQGTAIAKGQLTWSLLMRIGLTYLVPLSVALYSMRGTVPAFPAGMRGPAHATYLCLTCGAITGPIVDTSHDAGLPDCVNCGPDIRWVPREN